MAAQDHDSPGRRKHVFKDADFHREYKKLTGEEPDPLIPEDMGKPVGECPATAR